MLPTRGPSRAIQSEYISVILYHARHSTGEDGMVVRYGSYRYHDNPRQGLTFRRCSSTTTALHCACFHKFFIFFLVPSTARWLHEGVRFLDRQRIAQLAKMCTRTGRLEQCIGSCISYAGAWLRAQDRTHRETPTRPLWASTAGCFCCGGGGWRERAFLLPPVQRGEMHHDKAYR